LPYLRHLNISARPRPVVSTTLSGALCGAAPVGAPVRWRLASGGATKQSQSRSRRLGR
jgi:hypothetical protein